MLKTNITYTNYVCIEEFTNAYSEKIKYGEICRLIEKPGREYFITEEEFIALCREEKINNLLNGK